MIRSLKRSRIRTNSWYRRALAGNTKFTPFSVTGGTVTTSGGYVYHTFTSSGTLSVVGGGRTADVLIVAGGGSGGNYPVGAGGGAGGYVAESFTLAEQNYTITVGAGGTGGVYTPDGAWTVGTNGSNSSVTGRTTAIGGGRGGSNNTPVGNGGSGGGGKASANSDQVGGLGTSGQGNNGGIGLNTYSSRTGLDRYWGGGGGGAGGVGLDLNSNNGNGAAGGPGLTWLNGVTYAGGGGGGTYVNSVTGMTPGLGGIGGGGNGANQTASGDNGAPNTGGGAGGLGQAAFVGANGGSGIVIVRYPVA